MADTKAGTSGGRTDTNRRPQTSPGTDPSRFECDICGATRTTTAVDYDWLGYPICPVCTYVQSP